MCGAALVIARAVVFLRETARRFVSRRRRLLCGIILSTRRNCSSTFMRTHCMSRGRESGSVVRTANKMRIVPTDAASDLPPPH